MKAKLLIVLSICCAGLLMGCSTYSGGCGGGCGGGSSCVGSCPDYDHDSVCGQYSCTDNSGLDNYRNDCPGPYNCDVDP